MEQTTLGKKRRSLAVNGNMLSGTIRKWFPLFLLPTVAAFAIGFVYPFLRGIYLSFCKFTTTSNATWIGIDNYLKAFRDADSCIRSGIRRCLRSCRC